MLAFGSRQQCEESEHHSASSFSRHLPIMAASFMLDEESLRQEPEEVFDLLDKLGEGYVADFHAGRSRLMWLLAVLRPCVVNV